MSVYIEETGNEYGFVYQARTQRRMGFSPEGGQIKVWGARGWNHLTPEALYEAVCVLVEKYGKVVVV